MSQEYLGQFANNDELDPQQGLLAPVGREERLVSLDVLRGVAVLGILLMNVAVMGWPETWSIVGMTGVGAAEIGVPEPMGVWDRVVGQATLILGQGKFITMFSVLFGAGVLLMTERAAMKREQSVSGRLDLSQTAERSPAGLHYRRMAGLLVIGLIHSYFIWFGDVLVAYALCGMLLYPMRKLSTTVMVILAGVGLFAMIVFSMFFAGLFVLFEQFEPEQYERTMAEIVSPGLAAEEIAAYTGSWLDQTIARASSAALSQFFIFPLWTFWFCISLMLLGMVALRHGWLSGQWRSKQYLLHGLVLVSVGLVATLAIRLFVSSGVMDVMQSLYFTLGVEMLAAAVLSFGYMALILWWCVRAMERGQEKLDGVSRLLALAGRMALTNYLLASVLGTFVFYGWGLGYFGQWGRVQMLGVVLGIWVIQLALSWVWLGVLGRKHGPMEYLWRRVSYGGTLRQAA